MVPDSDIEIPWGTMTFRQTFDSVEKPIPEQSANKTIWEWPNFYIFKKYSNNIL